jgi:release factor glutamine methyltransferase
LNTDITRRELLRHAKQRLDAENVPVSGREIEWLLMETLGCSAADLLACAESPVSDAERAEFGKFIDRRLSREPVQHILGYSEFYGLRMIVGPDVMIPRPETETLVSMVLERISDTDKPVLVDVGTGSGCIAIALKKSRPDAIVLGMDISAAAISIARENGRIHDVSIEWVQADLFGESVLLDLTESVHVLVSNPPYIPESERGDLEAEVINFEPHLALFGGSDGLKAYSALGHLGEVLLRDEGLIMLEIHEEHGEDVQRIFRQRGYLDLESFPDLSGKERFVTGGKRPS